jgi:hypothetical protein
LLDEGLYIWSIRALVEAVDFKTWRPRVERITSFDLRLERPNPHYHGNDIAEQILEDLRLEYSRLIGTERDGEGVDDRSPLFQQALDHVLRDYGRASVRGVDQQGAESLWVKLRGMIGSVTSRRRIDGIGGEEAPEDVLRRALEAAPAGQTANITEVEDESF